MITKDQERQLALAGACQAAALVKSIARRGVVDADALEASISSILVTSPENTQQVYGANSNLRVGFVTLVAQLDNSGQKDAELTRYIASILSLERKLAKNKNALNELAQRVSHVQRQLAHVDFEHQQIISSLASIYSDIVSPLAPKIQVAGNPEHLGIESNQKKVRALLLAGIRSTVLWRQLGGRRRDILFSRKKIVASAREAMRLVN
ncbi:high frequency lysogenization protein HflD [Agaribacter marinus]|uniref:High frequency lysogenization protein HflD homolog n=1 Tax=Agaribacter marinus TaxID=1431249 RepID=A0AA37WJY5_9ALTE|nr:high frequency lysogenization protein HflD [Agaribacter marinus]GLR70385.1 high frequency lysogenization protein HflD [Agaribacter marinus]